MFETIGSLGFPALLLLFVIFLFLRNSSPTMRFARAKAFSPSTARKPASLGIEHIDTLEGPVRRGILVPIGDGRYYVNANRWKRTIRGAMMICVAVSIVFVIAIVT